MSSREVSESLKFDRLKKISLPKRENSTNLNNAAFSLNLIQHSTLYGNIYIGWDNSIMGFNYKSIEHYFLSNDNMPNAHDVALFTEVLPESNSVLQLALNCTERYLAVCTSSGIMVSLIRDLVSKIDASPNNNINVIITKDFVAMKWNKILSDQLLIVSTSSVSVINVLNRGETLFSMDGAAAADWSPISSSYLITAKGNQLFIYAGANLIGQSSETLLNPDNRNGKKTCE